MELARAFAAAPTRPKRSLLFAIFAAEERGLMGSYYYVAHPLRPLDTTRVVINFDMIGRNETPSQQTDGLIQIAADTANELNLIGTVNSPAYRAVVERQNRDVGLKLNYKWDDDSALNISSAAISFHSRCAIFQPFGGLPAFIRITTKPPTRSRKSTSPRWRGFSAWLTWRGGPSPMLEMCRCSWPGQRNETHYIVADCAGDAGPSAGPLPQTPGARDRTCVHNRGWNRGASVVHLETGRRVSLNAQERFPMASSYKIPIAIEVLQKVDDGELRLDQMVTLEAYDLHPGSGTLSVLFNKPGVALSIRNLMELTLLISDNAATDVLMRLAGGPEAVMARLKALGISGIDVSRPTVRLIADWAGIKQLPPERELTQQRFNQLEAAVPPQERKEAARRLIAIRATQPRRMG